MGMFDQWMGKYMSQVLADYRSGAPAQPPSPSYSGMGSSNPTPVLGNHERDRMQQDNTSDADAWWRNRGNY